VGKLWKRLVGLFSDATSVAVVSGDRPADTSQPDPVAASRLTEPSELAGPEEATVSSATNAPPFLSSEYVDDKRTDKDYRLTESVRQSLCDYLVGKGCATLDQVEEAQQTRRETRTDFLAVLVGTGISARAVHEARAHALHLPFVDLTAYKLDQSTIGAIPEQLARRLRVLPMISISSPIVEGCISDIGSTASCAK